MRITKRIVDAQKPSDKAAFLWDGELPGFCLKTLPTGRKTYLVQYRIGGRSGRTRRITLGVHGVITAEEARVKAKALLGQVAAGIDPAAKNDERKRAMTVGELLQKFLIEHVAVKLKPLSQEGYRAVVRLNVPKSLKRKPIGDVTRQDIVRIHYEMRETPYAANKAIAVLSKFFNWCEKRGYRKDYTNPCRHVEKYKEKPRNRFLSSEEQHRLGEALIKAENEKLATSYAINALRLLSLTGARLREILDLKWEYVDWEHGVLNLPNSKTGAKTIYLNPQAIDILKQVIRQKDNSYVLCGLKVGKPINNLQKPWRRIRAIAGLDDVRLHDLRHTFASVAVTNGMSLPMIGALLGHSQPRTTARYAHLAADPMIEAVRLIGDKISH